MPIGIDIAQLVVLGHFLHHVSVLYISRAFLPCSVCQLRTKLPLSGSFLVVGHIDYATRPLPENHWEPVSTLIAGNM